MKCRECDKDITKENRKIVNGGLCKSKICRPCYNVKIAVYNEKRKKALKESRWF